MNKTELVAAMAEKTGLTKKDSEAALKAFMEAVKETVHEKSELRLVGFGTFTVKETKERVARNPRTGEQVTIPAKIVPVFKVGQELKDSVK